MTCHDAMFIPQQCSLSICLIDYVIFANSERIRIMSRTTTSKPSSLQVITGFHRDLPMVTRLLPISQFTHTGICRFGFHGLSYTYLMDHLFALAGFEAAKGRIVLAHLGTGANMFGVNSGKPIDTSMAFTLTAGLVMATRPGDSDPCLLVYLMRQQNMSADEMDEFISRRSGLLSTSQTSADMCDLLAVRPADAIGLFCYQARKHPCALTGTLGGLDLIILAGGIGEHAPEVRARICGGLDTLGLKLGATKNAHTCDGISADQSCTSIRIIPADEEIVIVRIVRSILRYSGVSQKH